VTDVRYRADVVGSLLGPTELHEARAALAAGSITPREFKTFQHAKLARVAEAAHSLWS
jgi:methionine synthase II (cobalamin-independent)